MGKSLRSKVKKTYRGLKRQVLEPAAASRTLHLASTLYETAGLPLPDPAETGTGSGTGGNRAAWTHGGFVPVTTFVPTPPGLRLNRVHGPLAAAAEATAADGLAPAPRSDYVGEREPPVVTAKDLPLCRPVRGVFGGGGVPLPMPGVTSAVAAVAAEAGGGGKAGGAAAAAAPAGAAAGAGGEVAMADAAVTGRRREPRRKGRGGVVKKVKEVGAGQKRHPRNKINRVHRLR